MTDTKDKWQEIANRGLQDNFDPDTRAKFDEAVRRGLITLPATQNVSQETSAPVETQEDKSFSFGNMVRNIPGSTMGVVKETAQAVLHPIDTAKGLQSMGQGVVEKFIPNEINGVDFGQTQNEDAVDALGQMYKDRYGSIAKALNTLENDPAGFGLDASTLITGGATGGVKVANLAAKAVPKSMPRKMLSEAIVMGPKTVTKKQKAKIIDTLLTENIKPTEKGIEKAWNTVRELNQKVDDLIASAPEGTTFPRDVVLKYIDDVKAELGGKVAKGGDNLRIIEKISDDFKNHMDTQRTGDVFTPEELQTFKKNIYEEINWKHADEPLPANKAYLSEARAAREQLEEIHPDIKPTNRREGDIISALEHLDGISNKLENYRSVGMDASLKTLMAALMGAPMGSSGALTGAAIGGGLGALAHPRVRTSNAYMLEALRNSAPRTQARLNSLEPALIAQALMQGGSLNAENLNQ